MRIIQICSVFLVTFLLAGCANCCDQKDVVATTYGVKDSKWSVMSEEQQESAKSVYFLEEVKVAEKSKLHDLTARKADADEIRKIKHKQEDKRIKQENLVIKEQRKRVSAISKQEKSRQKLREQELNELKVSEFNPED